MKSFAKKSQLSTLQAGRALAAISVVIFHSETTLALPKYFGAPIFNGAKAMHFGVAFFFVLSGFLMMLVHKRDLGNAVKFSEFIRKRVVRIYPALLVALALSVILKFVFYRKLPDVLSLAAAVTASPIDVIDGPKILAVEWTLRHEMLFYAFFAILIVSPKKGAVAFAAWMLASAMFPYGRSWWGHILFSPYNLLFPMGMLCAITFKADKITRAGALIIVISGVTVFGVAWLWEVVRSLDDHTFGLVLAYGVGSALLLLGSAELERVGALSVGPTLEYLGEASYSIYLVHFLAVSAAAKIAKTLAEKHYFIPPVGLLFVILVALGFGVIFHIVVERFALQKIGPGGSLRGR